MTKNQITIDGLSDFKGTLHEFKNAINILIIDYGENSLISFDAGHNNVDIIIEIV